MFLKKRQTIPKQKMDLKYRSMKTIRKRKKLKNLKRLMKLMKKRKSRLKRKRLKKRKNPLTILFLQEQKTLMSISMIFRVSEAAQAAWMIQ